ncbi:MAG: MoxR family ATPase [Oscillospiraceae bacterium]|nr:MoxR family ATPase [Oscillospiraceae bacterium]
MQSKRVNTAVKEILAQLKKVIVGKDEVLLWVIAAILAKGHILLEDVPGVGKTTMAVALSKAMNLKQNRVQFTPDVLPSDVTGYSVLDHATGNLTYREGAVLCNLFLADELNRATSRSQSALLEAMEEGQVTVDGICHPLPNPFIVIATQNPTGAAGTQLLPDSQMDRFAVRLSLGYPEPREEAAMVLARQNQVPMEQVEQVITSEELLLLQQQVSEVFVSEEVIGYIVSLIGATRKDERILRGASPRATLAMTALAKALAAMRDRDFVIPEDVRDVYCVSLAHRLLLSSSERSPAEELLKELMRRVPSPKLV